MTFVLVSVVYAVAIGKPSFGVVGPFAVGLALFAMVFAGSQYTVSLCTFASRVPRPLTQYTSKDAVFSRAY